MSIYNMPDVPTLTNQMVFLAGMLMMCEHFCSAVSSGVESKLFSSAGVALWGLLKWFEITESDLLSDLWQSGWIQM